VLRALFKIDKPNDLEVTVTIKTTIGDIRHALDQFGEVGRYEADQILWVLRDVVRKADETLMSDSVPVGMYKDLHKKVEAP